MRQIISLGIGFDTFSLTLLKQNIPSLSLIEVDFENIMFQKAKVIFSKKILNEFPSIPRKPSLASYRCNGGYQFDSLHLISSDIRNSNELLNTLRGINVDPSIPTLILTECVLVYLEKTHTENLCFTLSSFFHNVIWVSYDMVSPHDAFGRVMGTNIQTAGYRIPGFFQYPSIESQYHRFLDTGWHHARSCTMLEAYNTVISAEKRKEANKKELFDEIEEWNLLMSHYCLTIAIKESNTNNLSSILDLIPS